MRLCRNRVAATLPHIDTKPDTPNPHHLPATHNKVRYKRVSTSHICTPKTYTITENQLQHTSVLLHNWHTIRSWPLSSKQQEEESNLKYTFRQTENWGMDRCTTTKTGRREPNTKHKLLWFHNRKRNGRMPQHLESKSRRNQHISIGTVY